jgi:hypothetical protein
MRNATRWSMRLVTSGTTHSLYFGWVDSTGTDQAYSVNIASYISLGVWTRCVATFDGTNARLYVGGVLIGTSSNSSIQAGGSQSTADYLIGSRDGSSQFLSAYLDEECIDSRAWSSSEVLNDYRYLNNSVSGFSLATDASEEPFFYGTIDRGGFQRTTSYNTTSTFSANADDLIKRIARKKVRSSRVWADYYLSRATPASNSLFHEYVKLATDKEVYNYLGNSGFENATIANSWTVGGVGASFARSNTVALYGTYAGYLSGTSGLNIYQGVVLEVSKGNKLTFQAYVYSTSAQTITMRAREYNAGTSGSYTDGVISHGGGGWELCSATHTCVDTDANRIYCFAFISGTAARFDMAMLTFGDVKYFYVPNTNDGTSGVIDGSTLSALGTYSLLGSVAEDVAYQHDWSVIKRDESPWEKIKALCDACLARLLHISQAGVLHFASYLATADETTSRGDIGNIHGLGKENQPITANCITVEGVYIDVRSFPQIVWTADGSSVGNESADGSTFTVSLADDEYYPDNTILPGGIECLYEDRKLGT